MAYWRSILHARLRCAWLHHFKLRHRKPGYRLLRGVGLEIGAFYLAAPLGRSRQVEYADAVSRSEALARFPELAAYPLVDVKHIVDLDRGELRRLGRERYDFVIINHVIEHVANPIQVVADLVALLRNGGHLVITAPDKDYSLDRPRRITDFPHLLEEYRAKTEQVTDAHYLDFLEGVYPEIHRQGGAPLAAALATVRARREHAHVWDSAAFRDFMEQAFRAALGKPLDLRYESSGARNRNEYFSVWQKA